MGTLLNSSEYRLFDSINEEIMRLAGSPNPVLWKFFKILPSTSVSGIPSQIDCLYGEPAYTVSGASKHYMPYPVMCFYEQPDKTVDATDDGLNSRTEGRVYFSRKNLEDAKVPVDNRYYHIGIGDIIQLWGKEKKTWYFEIVSVNRDGFEHDSSVWTQYVCDIVRNESFTPEQKAVK